jgi:hypothetical protein
MPQFCDPRFQCSSQSDDESNNRNVSFCKLNYGTAFGAFIDPGFPQEDFPYRLTHIHLLKTWKSHFF